MSLPARGAWIEMASSAAKTQRPPSLPARGAWIEIILHYSSLTVNSVAPRKGSVD